MVASFQCVIKSYILHWSFVDQRLSLIKLHVGLVVATRMCVYVYYVCSLQICYIGCDRYLHVVLSEDIVYTLPLQGIKKAVVYTILCKVNTCTDIPVAMTLLCFMIEMTGS